MSRCVVCGMEPRECECSIGDSSCIGVEGSGFTGNPLTFHPKIDPDPLNLLSCGGSGLEIDTGGLLDRPAVHITDTVGQSITANVATIKTFDLARYDTNSMADLAGNALVVQTPGVYTVTYACQWAGTSDTVASVGITLNGTTVALDISSASTGTSAALCMVSLMRELGEGDRLQILTFSIVTRTIQTVRYSNFAAVWERGPT